MRAVVSFVGAGPGAADLITLRGAARIGAADVVLFSPAAVDPTWLREQARADAELVDVTRLGADELLEVYRTVGSRLGRVVRLLAGDPALVPDLREQRETCEKLGLDVEVVPGVSPVSAAAASTGTTLVEPGADTVVSVEGVESVRELASPGRTLVVHAPAARAADLAEALLAAGLEGDVPVTVAYKVTWPSEAVLRTTVAELAAEVKKANLWRHAHFLIGDTTRAARPRPGYRAADGDQPARWTARARRPRVAGEARQTWPRRGGSTAEPEERQAEPVVEQQGAEAVQAEEKAVAVKRATKAAAKKPTARSPRTPARRGAKKA